MDIRTVNILLVEDDDIDAEAIQRAFTALKIVNPITVEPDGLDALDRLRGLNGKTPIPRPYLILLDLNLPRLTGLDFLEELRKDPELSTSIVFVLTTSNLDRDRVAAYEKHVAGYVLKSRVGEDFVELLGLIGAYWRVVEFPLR